MLIFKIKMLDKKNQYYEIYIKIIKKFTIFLNKETLVFNLLNLSLDFLILKLEVNFMKIIIILMIYMKIIQMKNY